MALIFQRLARNFIKNGYFPTDELSLTRILSHIAPAEEHGLIRLLDPCCGEGTALAELAHHLKGLGRPFTLQVLNMTSNGLITLKPC